MDSADEFVMMGLKHKVIPFDVMPVDVMSFDVMFFDALPVKTMSFDEDLVLPGTIDGINPDQPAGIGFVPSFPPKHLNTIAIGISSSRVWIKR